VKCAETLRDKLPLAVAFGRGCQSATTQLLQPLAKPFDAHRERQAIDPAPDFSAHTGDGGGMYRLSRCVPLAHEDKTFQDAHHPAIKARLFTQQKALALGSRERADAEFIGREIDRMEKIGSDFLRFSIPQLRVPP
jgi:hypothetical protein